jgi:hypothetical protein
MKMCHAEGALAIEESIRFIIKLWDSSLCPEWLSTLPQNDNDDISSSLIGGYYLAIMNSHHGTVLYYRIVVLPVNKGI